MLYLNPDEEKTIHFVVEINGVSNDDMNGYVRFALDEVEYGFPVRFEGDEVVATIPPLNDIFERKLKNGMVLEARLDLAAPDQNYYFKPWEDDITVKMPISVEAKVIEDGGGVRRPSVSVKAKPISERKKAVKEAKKGGRWDKRKLENLTENDIINYMKRAGTRNETVQQIVLNEATASAVEKGYKGKVGVLREVVRALKKPK
jgi:hypothetical protein